MGFRKCLGLLGGLVAWTVYPIGNSHAGTPIHFITHNGQEALLLGTVTAVTQTGIQFHPELVISGNPIYAPITIRHDNLSPVLAINDLALVSINRASTHYTLAYGASKVSSLNPETLKILDSRFRFDDLLILQWYVNSCGQVQDFAGSGATLAIQQPSSPWLPIAQKRNNTWVPLRKASFYKEACQQLRLTNRIQKANHVQQKACQQLQWTHCMAALLPWLGPVIATTVALYGTYHVTKRPKSTHSS